MKLELNIDDKQFSKSVEIAVENYLLSGKGQSRITSLVDKKVNDFLSERKIRDLVQERISRLILEDNIKGMVKSFSESDFENRIENICSRIMVQSNTFKSMLINQIKKTIKIG